MFAATKPVRAAGSFRDPSGFVFLADGEVYRQVNAGWEAGFRRLIDSGLYEDLARDGLLIPHEEVGLRVEEHPPAFAVLKPTRVPFITYPYEWCFSQLKDAALLTLELQKRALAKGLVLRDASAYNVQFVGTKPVFIDTLSFGEYEDQKPWVAYRQFCQHFLAPLTLAAHVDPSLSHLSRSHLDGVPLALASGMLPRSTWMRPGLLTHVHLHARSGARGKEQHQGTPSSQGRVSRTAMLGLVDSLQRTTEATRWSPPETLWSTYVENSNYSAPAIDHKRQLVKEALELVKRDNPSPSVWDLGANTGDFSRLAADVGGRVISFDLDTSSVERNYQSCKKAPEYASILPVVQDLTNPSPGLGWHHTERQSLVQRGPADVAMALALVHHLAISGGIPLEDLAAFFRDACRFLIIEFVPKEDSQVERMLALREDVFVAYTESGFEAAFAPSFKTIRSTPINGSARRLYFLERRS